VGHNLNWLFRDRAGDVKEVEINGRCLITHSAAIRQCALNDMGLALLPDWLVREDIRLGTLISLFDEYQVTATDFSSAVWILRPSRDYTPLKVNVFIEQLRKHLR
jgi:DNA-binding transcriptional LysR family regulator